MSYALKGLLALLLGLSIGIKVAGGDGEGSGGGMLAEKREVAAFLARQGFRVDQEDEEAASSPFVTAAVGACRLLVVAAAPQGWHRDIIHQLASPRDRVFFVIGGVVHYDQPQWRTWTDHQWRRLNRLVGRQLPARPVFGFVASPGCDLRGMAWRALAELP